jgi:hypothetical protein
VLFRSEIDPYEASGKMIVNLIVFYLPYCLTYLQDDSGDVNMVAIRKVYGAIGA